MKYSDIASYEKQERTESALSVTTMKQEMKTCNNSEISSIRETFMRNIRKEVPQLTQFSDKNIIDYCMILHDQKIQMPTSIFIKNLLCMYKEETEGLSISEERTIVTRMGRTVKKPNKLNL